MLANLISSATLISTLTISSLLGVGGTPLASRSYSLEDRYPNQQVNQVFKDNILLTLWYLDKNVQKTSDVNWGQIEKDNQTLEFTLNPGQTFAFHDDVLPQYQGKVTITTNAHFNYQEGFKNDGYLSGDGVCHLASLIYWAAKDANLDAYAPTRHDFAIIPDVPAQYGVSIYNDGSKGYSNEMQNLYITNNKDKPVSFRFDYQNGQLKVTVFEKSV